MLQRPQGRQQPRAAADPQQLQGRLGIRPARSGTEHADQDAQAVQKSQHDAVHEGPERAVMGLDDTARKEFTVASKLPLPTLNGAANERRERPSSWQKPSFNRRC